MPLLFPLLGSLLLTIATQFLSFFLKYYSRRIALVMAYFALVAIFWLAFAAAITLAFNGLYIVVPAYVKPAFAMFLPWQTSVCLSAIGTAHMGDFLLGIKNKLAKPAFGYF
ncbi:hypothetical protein [Neptunomonas sp.]|uniref:hypothetical protein n=1 Tax=Neptunomonas sp. TaxID=1971898 RepID=UPI0025F412A6|nr:hypothetical protein [Neptunomonas sp.]